LKANVDRPERPDLPKPGLSRPGQFTEVDIAAPSETADKAVKAEVAVKPGAVAAKPQEQPALKPPARPQLRPPLPLQSAPARSPQPPSVKPALTQPGG
jgi:hypothetical protein